MLVDGPAAGGAAPAASLADAPAVADGPPRVSAPELESARYVPLDARTAATTDAARTVVIDEPRATATAPGDGCAGAGTCAGSNHASGVGGTAASHAGRCQS